MAWYCSRDCQLRQWKKHKSICQMFMQTAAEAAAASKENSAANNPNSAAGAAKKGKAKKTPLI